MEQFNSEKILKAVSNLLYEYKNQDILSSLNYNNIRLRTSFSINTKNIYFIYNHRYKIQKELLHVTTHKGWEILLKNLKKELEQEIQVTVADDLQNRYTIFTDTKFTRIIGVLCQL